MSLSSHAVTDADQFLLLLETLGHAFHHVMNESAVKTVHRAVPRLIRRALKLDLIVLNGDLDVGIDLLAKLAVGAFNLQYVAREELNAHLVRKAYRQFTNS